MTKTFTKKFKYKDNWRGMRIGSFDLETTGFSADKDRITEFGIIFFEDGVPVERYDKMFYPGDGIKYPEKVQKITGITPDMLDGKKTFDQRAKKIKKLLKSCDLLVAQNSGFDESFLRASFKRAGISNKYPPVLDTLTWSRFFWPRESKHNLDVIIQRLNISPEKKLLKKLGMKVNRHRADFDSLVTGMAIMKMSQSIPSSLEQSLWVQDYIYKYWLAMAKGGNKRFARRVPHSLPK